jgi:hypothetical protein
VIRYLQEHLGQHRVENWLTPDVGTYYSVAQLEQYDALLVLATVKAVREHMTGSLPIGAKTLRVVGQVESDFLRLVGVRFVIARTWDELERRVTGHGPLSVAFASAFRASGTVVFQSTDELPRAFVLPGAVEDVARRPVAQLVAEARTAAAIERYGSTVVAVRLPPTGTAGTLILSDAFYPGWRAMVDGRPVPVHQVRAANLRAVAVPPASRSVIFHYAPGSVRWGLLVSVLTLGTLVGTVVAVRFREG